MSLGKWIIVENSFIGGILKMEKEDNFNDVFFICKLNVYCVLFIVLGSCVRKMNKIWFMYSGSL